MAYSELEEIGIRKVVDWPHIDKDITITLDSNQRPTQIEVVSFGRTKTITITYASNQIIITSIIS